MDQTLALLGESLGVELVSLERGSTQTRWVSRDLPAAPLPVIDHQELVDDARSTLRYARHPLTAAGLSSLLALPLPGATLWLGAFRTHAFDERSVKQLARWGQLVEKLLTPAGDSAIYRRFIAMMAAPAMYLNAEAVFLNRAAELLTGYRADEVATLDTWFDRLYEQDAPTVRAMYELDRQHHFGSTRVTTLRRKDGSERLVECAARREGPHEVWLLHDVTERVASQERFRVLFEQSSTALSLYDELGLIDCNPAAVALLGYTAKADVLHRRPAELSPPTQPGGLLSADKLARMENIALTQGSHRFDWVYRTVAGPDARVEVTLTPLTLGARRVLLAEWHDISERLRYEEGLEAARDSALAYARARSDFLATMSHEIRTPMNGVIGMTQLLAETALSEQQREYVDTVRACGEGLLALINDILDFSRLEAGKVQLESIPFSVRELAEDAVSVVAPQAHGKQLELTCRIASDVPAVAWGDPTRLRQVLLNLLANAVKFTAKGAVEMKVTCRPHGATDQVTLEFSVKDSGIGIAPEALPRLFSAFSQEDGSTTRRFGGSGLGLVICKGLTQLMRGGLEVASSPEGSTFTVALPLKVHTQAVVVPDLSGHSIAVLELRPASRAALVAQLAPTGIVVSTPANVSELGEAQVVLVDQGFEGDGAGLAARLAAQGRQVGLLRRLDGSSVEEVGAAFVLPTPVREYRLHQQLERVLFRRPTLSRIVSASAHQSFDARVLVAEDNRVNQRVVRGLLEKLGCAVTIVDNGVQAVDTLGRGGFDLVLMDCQMPELDGFAATKRIRATQLGHVPIIALTAGVMDGDRERCLAAGMDEFLRKPVRIEELERALERWL
ncbi:MAG: ATP-binding protein [Archangium sp.]|nr:ATP-binding protein [Archangium sp.]